MIHWNDPFCVTVFHFLWKQLMKSCRCDICYCLYRTNKHVCYIWRTRFVGQDISAALQCSIMMLLSHILPLSKKMQLLWFGIFHIFHIEVFINAALFRSQSACDIDWHVGNMIDLSLSWCASCVAMDIGCDIIKLHQSDKQRLNMLNLTKHIQAIPNKDGQLRHNSNVCVCWRMFDLFCFFSDRTESLGCWLDKRSKRRRHFGLWEVVMCVLNRISDIL